MIQDYYFLTPSLPQVQDFRADANGVFSFPITHLLSMQCILMKVLSHTSVKKKTERLKHFKFHTFTGHFRLTSQQ